jgi:hypothetical protein
MVSVPVRNESMSEKWTPHKRRRFEVPAPLAALSFQELQIVKRH